MNVLGLVSSPRRLGNSELAVKEMMRRLPPDWEKKMIRISDLRIKPCKACYGCLPVGKPCVQEDDLAFLLKHIREADKIILSAPCYVLGAHTAVKVIMDRLFSIMPDFETFEGKECVLIMSYGRSGWEGIAREEMMLFVNALNLKILGDIMLNATMPGDCLKPDHLKLIVQLAHKLVHPKDAFSTNCEDMLCPVCGSRLIKLTVNARWSCAICGVTGRLTVEEGHIILNMDSAEDCRFSYKHRSEHQDYLKQMKAEFLRVKDDIKAVQKQYSQEDLWVSPEDA
jgi:multimeric flavodoxin WrbA